MELWASKTPYAYLDGKPLTFVRQHFGCLAQADGLLLVRYSGDYIHIDILVAHAPTMMAPPVVRKKRWDTMEAMLDKRTAKKRYSLIVLGDLNASIDSVNTELFADCNDAVENENGAAARQISTKFSMFMPATWNWCHHGEGGTFTHPTGLVSRKDYVMVCPSLFPCVRPSYVDQDVDLSLARDDHKSSVVELAFSRRIKTRQKTWPLPYYHAPSLDMPEVAEKLNQHLNAIDNIPWYVDPETHAN